MKTKVLVIDDEENIRESVKDYLELCDFDVKVAEDGEKGIQCALTWKPDLILSDLKMPLVGGDEVIKNLRNTEGFRETPIIIFSAITDERSQQELLVLGATRFVAKPFRLPELVDLIERLGSEVE